MKAHLGPLHPLRDREVLVAGTACSERWLLCGKLPVALQCMWQEWVTWVQLALKHLLKIQAPVVLHRQHSGTQL